MKRILLRSLLLCGLLSGQAAWGYLVHVVQQIEVDGVVVETIDETHDAPVALTTSNAVTRSGYTFTHWSTSAVQEFVGRDPWGRAYEQVAFTVYEPMTNTAHYVREELDNDGDGMPDGLELYWYGNLDQTRDSDTDGDGLGFALELELVLNPHFADAWRRGLAVTSVKPTFFELVIASDPEDELFATQIEDVAPGVLISTPSYDPRTSTFAYWTVNGVEQRDAFGRALDRVSFEMPTNDVEVIAVCEEDEAVRAALYWYGDDTVGWESDTDGDGYTLQEEFALGLNPHFKDEYVGGIKTASRKPQFFKYTVRSEPEGMLFATMIENVCPGVVKTTTAYQPTTSRFAYWTVNGRAVRDDFGRALDCASVEMPTNDIEVVAHCVESEETRQSLYWYGVETETWTSDTDQDGYTLQEEVALGLNPLFADVYQRGILCASRKPQFFKYTVRSEPEGTLFATTVENVCPGVVKTTAAYSPKSSQFAYWTVAGQALRDDFGRALDVSSIEMPTNDIVVVAHCVANEETRQSLYWYGDETNGWDSDTDRDGLTLKEEVALGLNPLFADAWERGILSAMKGFELFNCIIRSEPEGALFATQKLNIGPGVSVTTPTCDEKSTGFASWYLNGARQADEFGRAWNAVTFAMPARNTEVVAVVREDAAEQEAVYWYGDASVSPDSDTDGDGFTLAEERVNGTNPLFADTNQFTGVRYALSEELEVDLQPFEQMRGTIVDGDYAELFTSPLAGNEGESATFAENSSPLAVDVNGDGLFDLVVAAKGKLRVFVNKGAAANPDFSEISVETDAWANFARLIADMARPVVCGANGVFYVSDDGGPVYKFTLADGSIMDTGLAGIPSVFDGRLIVLTEAGTFVCADAGYTMILDTPVIDGVSVSCADIDADGRTDVLVSDRVGHVWLYRNTTTRTIKTEQLFTLQYKVWAGTGAGFAEGIAISLVDWEDDGDYDVVLGTEEGKLMLLRDPKTGRPTNVRAYPGADNVLLEWDPNAQPRIRGYNVYRAPDAESYLRIANQTPLPSYRDVPSVLQDYWYRITGVSRFYIAGNSTPTVNESMPTDAVYVQFRPSVWLNDTSSFTDTNVEVIVSMNNSMGISTDGFSMTFEYDPAVLTPVAMKTSGLTEGMAFGEVKVKGEGERWNWQISATGGEIGTGSGRFLRLVFYVKPVHDVTETTVSITAATVKAGDGRAVMLDLPKSAKIEISDSHPIVPAIVSVNVADAAVETESEFELPVTITSTETLTNFVADVAFDETLLEFRGCDGATARLESAPSRVETTGGDFVLKFSAKDPESVMTNLSTVVSLTNVVASDCHGFVVNAADASGTVLLKNVHPWVPATVNLSTLDRKVDTMTEFEVPVTITSDQKLTNLTAMVGWDEKVLELRGVNGASLRRTGDNAPYQVVGDGGNFKLKFYAKDQHDVTKTMVGLSGVTAVDEHGLVANPIADAEAGIVIHDAHPLVPAKVTMTLSDVAAKTESDFEMTLAIATTEALQSLAMEMDYDQTLLTFLSGELVFSDGVPSSVVYRFHALENHSVDKTTVTIRPKSGVDHNGLAAVLPESVSGTVVLADSNPWKPATVALSMTGVKVDTLTEFEVPVKVTSNEKLTNLTATVEWDEKVLELRGANGASLRRAGDSAPYQVVGDGGNFKLKFYAKDQHEVTKTTVGLSGVTAVDEHGLVANPIADVEAGIVIHDTNPPIPAQVTIRAADVATKTRQNVTVPIAVTSTKELKTLSVRIGFDSSVLEYKSCTGGTWNNGVITVDGTVPSVVNVTFYAKDQHSVTKTAIALSNGAATCTEDLTANVSVTSGTMTIADSNPPVAPPVAPTMAMSALDVKAESGKPFVVNVGAESIGGLSEISFVLEWDSEYMSFVGCKESATVETLSANSRRFTFAATGTDNRYHLNFTAALISELKASSWAKVTAASATGVNGLAAQLETKLPITANVLIVREINKYDPGDINGDGLYTDADLELLNKYIAYQNLVKTLPASIRDVAIRQALANGSVVNLTGRALTAADVNQDKKVDANDISMLAQYIAAAKEAAK